MNLPCVLAWLQRLFQEFFEPDSSISPVDLFKICIYFQIEIICNDMELGTDFTLHFIRETIADETVRGSSAIIHCFCDRPKILIDLFFRITRNLYSSTMASAMCDDHHKTNNCHEIHTTYRKQS